VTDLSPAADTAADTGTDASAPARDEASARRPWTLQRKLIVTVVSITSFIMVLVGVATSAILGNVLEAGLTDQVANAAARTSAMVQRQLASGMTAQEILQEQPQQPGFLLAVQSGAGEPTAAVME
jgi:two-component system OmpR family sensor kinase